LGESATCAKKSSMLLLLKMVARARTKAKRARITAEFKVGTIEALDFADDSMDVVLSSLMFHHLTERLQDAGLAEIQRVLKPNGRLVVVDFGTSEQLQRKAQAAGYKVLSAAPLGPKFLYAFVAETGAVETA
jgi:ubiquinone/menaquinone biosynthesis C-methylase UbiE